jgi:sulfur relay (sulfurtransferase) complex TusBCD TusD component (DsrE family)
MAKFLFILGKDDNEAATRCFQFARIAHAKGHHVNLFFIDSGVLWADTARDLKTKTLTGDCPADYLPYLVQEEIEIGVCTPCAKNRGVVEDRFYPNMALSSGARLIDLAAEAKVFNF